MNFRSANDGVGNPLYRSPAQFPYQQNTQTGGGNNHRNIQPGVSYSSSPYSYAQSNDNSIVGPYYGSVEASSIYQRQQQQLHQQLLQQQQLQQQKEVQIRIMQARQQNLTYKQALMKEMIMQEQNQIAAQRQYQQRRYQQQQQQQQRLLPEVNIRAPPRSAGSRSNLLGRGRRGVTGIQGGNNSNSSSRYFFDASADGHKEEQDVQLHTMQSESRPELQLPPLTEPAQQATNIRNISRQSKTRRSVNLPQPLHINNPPASASDTKLNKNLNNIAQDLSKLLDDNKKELSKAAKQKHENTATTTKRGDKNSDEQRRSKQQIEQILKQRGLAGQLRLPLWRHKLQGRLNPPDSQLLRGKSLWRAITKALIHLCLLPHAAVAKRRLQRREINRRDLSRSLRLVADECDDWLGKLVQLPVASIVQDAQLNFEPAESYVSNAQPIKLRMLQLKVRLKAIVCNIAKSPMPSASVTSFLIDLVNEDNYFSPELLWDCEVDQLEFTSLGATTDMLFELPLNQAVAATTTTGSSIPLNNSSKKRKSSNTSIISNIESADDTVSRSKTVGITDEEREIAAADAAETDPDIFHIGGNHSNSNCNSNSNVNRKPMRVNARCARLLIQNFIFIRVLISHLLLSPWHYNISSKPGGRNVKRTLYNYRMLATVFYELLLRMDPLLPSVSATAAVATAAVSLASRKHNNSSSSGVNTVEGEKNIALSKKLALLSQKHSDTASSPQNKTLLAPLEASGNTASPVKLPAVAATATAVAASSDLDHSLSPGKLDPLLPPLPSAGKSLQNSERKEPGGLLGKISKLVGMNDTTPAGQEKFSQDSVESRMLEPRATFSSLADIHAMLIPSGRLSAIKSVLDEWCTELLPALRQWLRQLVQHVLNRRLQLKTVPSSTATDTAAASHY